MKQSVTARGRVLPSSRWIFLALVGTFVLALSGSALAETPEGSTAAATQEEDGQQQQQQQQQQLPVTTSSSATDTSSEEEEEDPVISSPDKIVDPAVVQDSLDTLESEEATPEREQCSENAADGQCNSLLKHAEAEDDQWEWAVFKEDASREWNTLSTALDSSHPVLRGLVYAGLCALVGCAGSVVMAVVVGAAFYLAFVRGKKHD